MAAKPSSGGERGKRPPGKSRRARGALPAEMPRSIYPTLANPPWTEIDSRIRVWLGLKRQSTALAFSKEDVRILAMALREAMEWSLYKQDYVETKRRLATAELVAREYTGRQRDDEILYALGFKKRGGRPTKRIGEGKARVVIDKYKELLMVRGHVLHWDEAVLWASGYKGNIILGKHEKLRPTGRKRMVAFRSAPLTPRAAVETLVDWFPESFSTTEAAISFLERHRDKTGDDFPIPSRSRKSKD
jgi:hypothetical protein